MFNVNLPYDGNVTVYDYKDGINIFKEELKNSVITVKGKNENARNYTDIIMSFDVETSNVLNDNYNDKMPKMYKYFNVVFCWQVSINGKFIFGRSIDDFFYLIDEVNKFNKRGYIICYVHNLAYEMGNLKDYFFSRITDENDAFFKNKSTALYLRCGFFQFQCSKELTHLSLQKIGKNINYDKLAGDFDYNKQRYINTELTPLELNYCYRDVMILDKFIRSECINYCTRINVSVNPCNLPLTSTGYVRRDVQKNFSKTPAGRVILQKTALEELMYKDINNAYWGGYTHADYKKICKSFNNVGHRDITSAYPSQFFKTFPYHLTLGNDFNVKTFKSNLKRDNFAIIGNITLKGNVCIKPHKIPYLPESRCNGAHIVSENGKILLADSVTLWACECDINIILDVYNYDELIINKYYWGAKRPLPWRLVNTVISYFKNKTIYKDVEGYEVEYALAKQLLNGVYGMAGTSCIHPKLILNGLTVENSVEEYTPSNTLAYQWAIYITAYVRQMLYGFINDLAIKYDDAFIYSDTDSIFYIKNDDTEKYFEEYNRKNREFMNIISKFYPDAIPLTPKGKPQYLGAFEMENDDIQTFITLGAKRYAITHGDGLIDITFAGLSATKCVKNANGVKCNGYNTQRLLNMYGDIETAFNKIKNGCITLPYIEGVDKLSNYNTVYDYKGVICGETVTRPCSYVLYGQSTTLSLNTQLFNVLMGDVLSDEFF